MPPILEPDEAEGNPVAGIGFLHEWITAMHKLDEAKWTAGLENHLKRLSHRERLALIGDMRAAEDVAGHMRRAAERVEREAPPILKVR